MSVWQNIWGQINVCLPYPAPFGPEPLGKIVEQESNTRFQGAKWGPVNRSVEHSHADWDWAQSQAGQALLAYAVPHSSLPLSHVSEHSALDLSPGSPQKTRPGAALPSVRAASSPSFSWHSDGCSRVLPLGCGRLRGTSGSTGVGLDDIREDVVGSHLWLSEQDPILPAEVVVCGADDKDG